MIRIILVRRTSYNEHGELDWSRLDGYSVVVVSHVPSEDGPFGPKHVKDIRSWI
jgi:hypothetical protein